MCGRAGFRVTAILLIVVFATTAAWAHEVTYLGTVVAVETTRLQVKTTDPESKKEQTLWFLVDKNTTIKRGDKIVSLANAKIMKGERIAVTIDHDAKTKMLAVEIKVADMDTAMAVMQTRPPSSGPPPPPMSAMAAEHQMPGMKMGQSPAWHSMQDGVISGLFNHQGGPRGGNEFVVPNWWMGMLMKEKGHQQFGLNAMLSLDPATVGKSGYREIFQVGEALDGKPLIDHQHPHDLFMQLAASWRREFGANTALTLAGGPVGEPTLGPIAFMHRPSAAGLLLAPLGHHTFDSTHISFGVVTAALDRGRWTFEGSAFNGREPDEDRWDFDFGAMDSAAGRVWFRPTDEWTLQVSTGHLRSPEAFEPGDVWRTTTSASWFRKHDDGFAAIAAGYGVNARDGERRYGVFGEFTVERHAHSVFGRVEFQQVETGVLLTDDAAASSVPPSLLAAITIGASRRLAMWKGFETILGAEATFYGVPEPLRISHGDHPVSFQAFFRFRLPTGSMGRMWDMRMSQSPKMDMTHSGHEMH